MKILLLLLAGAALSGVEAAQSLVPKAALVLNLDYARFRYDDQKNYLEVYYGLYPNLLTYHLSAGTHHAGVKLTTRVRQSATKVLLAERRALLPLAITDTSGSAFRFPCTTQAGYIVPFGDYTLEVVAVDSLNPARRDSINLPIKTQSYPEKLAISDLELCSRVQMSGKKDDPFFKNSLEVVPNPSLVFGVATHPVVFNYAELYNLDPAATYTAKNQIVGADGRIAKESSRPRKYGMKHGVEAGQITVTSVASGKYTFRLLLLDQSAREVARAEKTFFVYNPHLHAPAAGPAAGLPFDAAQLAGLSGAELSAEFQQAQYLATSDEAKMFAQLESDIGKREFLMKFWADVETGRFGRSPMKRTEYLRRVANANQSYRVLNKEGWRTDRGRVYLLYGEPDQIERVPGEAGTKPHQKWSYFNIEKGVEFVFVDRYGNGDFQLVHSTKRGELQDENWERFLQ
jgi:GWxTD domain-containing protein